MKNQTLRTFLAIAVVVGVLGYFAYREMHTKEILLSTSFVPVSAAVVESLDVPPLTKEQEKTIAKASASLPQTYKNDTYGFSLQYPDGFSVGDIPESDGTRTILLQDTSAGVGIQIYISPFIDEDTILTPERIARDIPGITVESPSPVSISGRSGGIAFISRNPLFGVSREVWFVYRDHLYQLSTYITQDPLMEVILSTWKFSK